MQSNKNQLHFDLNGTTQEIRDCLKWIGENTEGDFSVRCTCHDVPDDSLMIKLLRSIAVTFKSERDAVLFKTFFG